MKTTLNFAAGLPQRIVIGVSCGADSTPPDLHIAAPDLNTFQHALWLAEQSGAAVHLVHVVDFVDAKVTSYLPELEELVTRAFVAAMGPLEREAEARGVTCTHRLVHGNPWYELLREAHRWEADLIMVSPRRDLGFSTRLLHGSTTNRLVRKAACPVWVVDPSDDKPGVRRVLALLDGSDTHKEVAATALQFTKRGATGIALHCMDYPEDIVLRRLPDAQRAIRNYHQSTRDRMRGIMTGVVGDRDDWTIRLEDDWIGRVAPRIAEEEGIDLIVMACVSYPALKGVLLGSTAERVLQRCHVSMLVVRPEGWRSPVVFDAAELRQGAA